MRNITLCFLALFVTFFSKAQTITTGTITLTGVIKDSTNHSGLENATVELAGKQNKVRVLANKNGAYSFSHLSPGDYQLTAGFVGYSTHIQRIHLDKNDTTIVLADILLTVKGKQLQSVVVTGSKLLVENKIDRLVYNVDKDITSQGGVATDVLRKIPQVTVDINGNVELLGNPSVRFLINGKPSTIFGNSVSDALQSIPASQIQSIEVMSSPGAKYDATGTGGIINIVLKKNKAEGFSGTINATAGTRLENGSLNLNYKHNNVSVNGFFSGNTQLKSNTLNELTRNAVDTTTGNLFLLHQNGTSDLTRYGYRAGTGLDWDITPKDNLSFSIGYNSFGNTNNGTTRQQNIESDSHGNKITEENSLRHSNSELKNSSIDFSVAYRKKMAREKEELSISATVSAGNNNTYYLQSQQYITNDSIFTGSTSKNPGKDKLGSFAIDYAVPLSKKVLLETGLKAEVESLESNANVYAFRPSSYKYVFDDRQSYNSTFKRQVYAGYASFTFNLFNYLNVIAGARWEYTINKASYSNTKPAVVPDYSNFGPSLTISHDFENKQTLKFSYAYRLERPEYRDLNPFVNLTDPHNISTGDPAIKPEIGRDFQLGYSRNFNGDNSINIVLLYTYNSPDIKSFTKFYPAYQVGDSVYDNVNVTTRSNIAAETRWGLSISGAANVATKLTLRPSIQLYDRWTDNIYSIPTRIGGFEYRGNLNITYQFSQQLAAEVFGNYRSGIRWQGRQPNFYSYTLAIRQQLFKGKGSLGVVAVNPFEKYLTQKYVQQAVGFTSNNILQVPYRSFGINFMYKFGKLKISKPKEADNLLTKPPVEN